MGPSISLLQATRSFPHLCLPPSSELEMFAFFVLRHVSLSRPLRRLPSSAHVSAMLGSCLKINKFESREELSEG